MTHEELVQRAVQWLRGPRGCRVVVWERNWNVWEQPDALGWTAQGMSVLVECKTSRADFSRDSEKPFRKHPTLGMGVQRYFMTVPGLLDPKDIPVAWGLLECFPKKVRTRVHALHFAERNLANEVRCLVRYGGGKTEDPRPVFNGSHI